MTSRLILASASPQRSDILQKCCLHFVVVPAAIEEWEDEQADPVELSQKNAEMKAQAVAEAYPDDVVVAADTIVLSRGKVLSKPQNFDHALQMFESYQNQVVSVFSGVAVHYQDRLVSRVDETKIRMRSYSQEQYLKMAQKLFSLDKSGGFTIEGMGAVLFDALEGSFYNVLGLPVHLLHDLMADVGLSLWDFREVDNA